MNVLFLVLAAAAGAAISLQAAINSQLASGLGGVPIAAAFISFLVGTLALGVTVWTTGSLPGAAQLLTEQPLWRYGGGLLGALAIASTVILAPRLGLATLLALVIAGQLVASLIIDNYALLGTTLRPVTPVRILGAVIMIAGVGLVLFGDRLTTLLRIGSSS